MVQIESQCQSAASVNAEYVDYQVTTVTFTCAGSINVDYELMLRVPESQVSGVYLSAVTGDFEISAIFTQNRVRFDVRARDVVNESTDKDIVLLNLQVHTLVSDVLTNLRAAAEANTLLGNDYVIDVNSVTLRDRKSR